MISGIRLKKSSKTQQPVPQQQQPQPQPQPKPAQSLQASSGIGIRLVKKQDFTGKNVQRVRQAFDELREAMDENQQEYENIIVENYYTDKQRKIRHPEILKVTFKGRNGGEPEDHHFFAGKAVVGRIEFRDDYPEAPPKFFFERLPNGQYLELMNVYGTGEVCHFTINKEVWKKVKSPLKKIVLQLESLFYSPNLNDPANLELADIYENDQKEYWRRMHDQAKNFMSAEDVE